MHFPYSAPALALLASSVVLAHECPAGYERPKIVWTACPVDGIPSLQCSTLEVPMDYANWSGDVLKLRLVRVPAKTPGPNSKSIIYNPGGPGSSGIEGIVDKAGGVNLQELAGSDFHIVSFDPRGTGLSIPFTCPALSRPRDLTQSDEDYESVYSALSLQSDKCAETEYKNQNELMGTAYVARDIKAIAEALGEDGLIRYLGYSYGTLLGATTAAMFPHQIDRMVLDGNINPTDYYRGLGEEALADVDRAVSRFFFLCAAAGPSDCAIANTGTTGQVLQTAFDTFLASITYEQSYVIREDLQDVLYDPAKFKGFADKLKSYYANRSTIPKRSLRARQEAEGEGNDSDDKDEVTPPQATPSPQAGGFLPTDSAKVHAPLALSGITCGDVITRPAGSATNFKRWKAIYQRTSKYSGDGGLLSTLYTCSLWKNDAKEKFMQPFSNIATKNPILFVNTQYDPVTPLISAQNSATGFVGARVLVSSGVGHCSNAQPSKLLDATIKKYFADASFPAVNQIYTPDHVNAFVEPAEGDDAEKKRRKSKRNVDYASLWSYEPTLVRRTDAVPVGCVKIPLSSSSVSMAASSTMSVVSSSIVSSASSVVSSASASVVSASSAVSSVSSTVDSASSSMSSAISSVSSTISSTPSTISSAPTTMSTAFSTISDSTSMASASSDSSMMSLASSTVSSAPSSMSSISASSAVSSASSTFSTVSSASQSTSTSAAGQGYGDYSGSSSSSAAVYGDYPGSSSSSSIVYGDYHGSSSSSTAVYGDYASSSSTHLPAYGGYASSTPSSASSSTPTSTPVYNNAYGYPVSSPSPTTTMHPSTYVPITKIITETSCETITQCSGGYNCQVSTITKTLTRTTVVTVPTSASIVVVTVKSAVSSAPGQGYHVHQSMSAPGQGFNAPPQSVSAPGQGSNVPQSSSRPSSAAGTSAQQSSKPASPSVPAVSQPGYGTPAKPSGSAPAQSSGPAALPSSASFATYIVGTGVYSKPTGAPSNGTKSSGTPTGGLPAQFTGAAATERALLSFVALVVGITSMVFML